MRSPLSLIALLVAGAAFAGTGASPAPKKKSRRKAKAAAEARDAGGGPARVTGGDPDRLPEPSTPYPNSADVTVHHLADGKTMYEIQAAQVAESPVQRDVPAGDLTPKGEIEDESGRGLYFRFPKIRKIDPVVQGEAYSYDAQGVPAPKPPTTGFNFIGVGNGGGGGAGGTPPDINGSIGCCDGASNSQYVQTVNTSYAVYTLNRGTNTATRVTGYPKAINTLFTTLGGACASQNSGDPIVVFDKMAGRWLISQFTTTASGGNYYECVAISKTGDATGAYWLYAFAFPGGKFGDYPHISVWPDGYYMMVHQFTSTGCTNCYEGGGFAVMNRANMLTGAAATMQYFLLPTEGGHLPADVDGFTLPPYRAPGIFLALSDSSLHLYRMKVDWTTPANTTLTMTNDIPVAPFNQACLTAATAGTCITQPGSTGLLDALADRLMFRLSYRNFVDHETLVATHSVDPGNGRNSGVRWYEIRISGSPTAQCPTYPCLYQQGTYAPDTTRDRWMGSIATDFAGNMLLGYSTSGLTANSDNHSIRYTGRLPSDTLGQMTQTEQIIQTGTKNESGATRWGDYSSMSVDPFDDCTMWYTNEYYTTTGSSTWSTRIASMRFPAGSASGQCPASTCTPPASAPGGTPTISVPGNNQIQLGWAAVGGVGGYVVQRAVGACGSEGIYQDVSATVSTSFTDNTVQGGVTYSYRIASSTDAAGRCQSSAVSNCVSATATGNCTLAPTFAGLATASSADQATCGVALSWSAASSNCPTFATVKYNIYRSTQPDFTPSAANRIATCITGTSYTDSNNLTSGTTYFYAMRAEDSSTANGGPCNGGNQEANSYVVGGTPYGVGTSGTPTIWSDNGGDGKALLVLNAAGTGNTTQNWRYISTAVDAGANHTASGAYAYRDAGPAATDLYTSMGCSELSTPALTVGATSVSLSYWERHNLEFQWDGVAVEYSVNGGAWNNVPNPSPATDWAAISQTGAPPANACGYAATKVMYTGPSAQTLNAYTQRTHSITGLTIGNTLKVRWRHDSDPALAFQGFYLDDIAITNINMPNSCTTGLPRPSEVTGGGAGGMLASKGSTAGTVVLNFADMAGATGYNVYEGALPLTGGVYSHGTTGNVCAVTTTLNTGRRSTPAAGLGTAGSHYYLVTQYTTAEGPSGFNSSSVEIDPSKSTCAP